MPRKKKPPRAVTSARDKLAREAATALDAFFRLQPHTAQLELLLRAWLANYDGVPLVPLVRLVEQTRRRVQ